MKRFSISAGHGWREAAEVQWHFALSLFAPAGAAGKWRAHRFLLLSKREHVMIRSWFLLET
jgi:hypothetical protein